MSSRINLNDNTNDRFEFSVGGLDYDLKYPTLEEIDPISDLYKEREKAQKENTPESVEKIENIDNRLQEALYGLIVPVGHSVPIRETLKKQPYPVVKAFNKMMAEQMAAE